MILTLWFGMSWDIYALSVPMGFARLLGNQLDLSPSLSVSSSYKESGYCANLLPRIFFNSLGRAWTLLLVSLVQVLKYCKTQKLTASQAGSEADLVRGTARV